jgi:hypothetical protein
MERKAAIQQQVPVAQTICRSQPRPDSLVREANLADVRISPVPARPRP